MWSLFRFLPTTPSSFYSSSISSYSSSPSSLACSSELASALLASTSASLDASEPDESDEAADPELLLDELDCFSSFDLIVTIFPCAFFLKTTTDSLDASSSDSLEPDDELSEPDDEL